MTKVICLKCKKPNIYKYHHYYCEIWNEEIKSNLNSLIKNEKEIIKERLENEDKERDLDI